LKTLRFTILILLICSFKASPAQVSAKKDSLVDYILLKNQQKREDKVIRYIKSFFQNAPLNQLVAKKKAITDTFVRYNLEQRESILYFMESIYQRRLEKLHESQNALIKAIDEAHKSSNHWLLFNYFTHLAFVQTDEGNAIGAVSSYGLAKNEVKNLNDPYLEAVLNVNISDIYYKSGLYGQSISNLNQAQRIID
jgi:tetratricopeptide (TPR) repeat protein